VWFGGIPFVDEAGSVEQTMTLPEVGSAELSFWLLMGVDGGTGNMRVLLDGDELFAVTEADEGAYSDYTQVVLDVSAYADGEAHLLRLESNTVAGGITNFFIDDVVLAAGDPLPAEITITFNVQVLGEPGDTINNLAILDWGDDYTSDMHSVIIPPLQSYELSVTLTGAGQGAVTSVPPGIDCGNDCSFEFNEDTLVTLTATPAPGSTFTGWGGACTGTGICVVTMDEARGVSASFSLVETEYKIFLPLILRSE
jgi:hypothetical protein